MTALLIISALILLNAVFVAAEFAIVGAPKASIDRRAAEGNALAKSVQSVLRDLPLPQLFPLPMHLVVLGFPITIKISCHHNLLPRPRPLLARRSLLHLFKLC